MFRTLYSRMLLYFVIISLSSIILVGITIQQGFKSEFGNYLDLKRSDEIQMFINQVIEDYEQRGGFTEESLSWLLHEQSMSENLYYQIYDASGNLIIDSTTFIQMIGGMMDGNNDQTLADFTTTTIALESDNDNIGTVKVFMPKVYDRSDFQFLNQINKYILISSFMMVIVAIFVSLLFSKSLSAGLRNMRNAATELQNHNLSVRIPLENLPDEMKDLAKSFNQLAESLYYQENLRKQFTGDLAHELRTPLATLRSQLEAFQDGVWDPTSERLMSCHEELMRLVRLVNDLEKLLAAENPQIELHKEPIESQQMLQMLSDHFRTEFTKKKITFNVEEGEQSWFEADKDRFIQIMTNLLNNALKYTPQGGRVIFFAEKENDRINFNVKDSGVGISKEDLPHVFERFYRGDKSRDRKTGGVGIGLSIVKALVQAHNGNISVDSDIGKGTTVVVSFPLSK